MRILVGYASAAGSTQGIAERIAKRLQAAGHTCIVELAQQLSSAAGCDAVVLGSAIHNGQWLPDAASAVARLVSVVPCPPVCAFSVSSVGATTSTVSPSLARFLRSRTPLPRAVQHLAAVADLRGHHFFAGAIAQGDWPGLGRVVFRLMGGRYGDARDWKDIDSWSHAIARELDAAPPKD